MSAKFQIKRVYASEIIDSRGTPTVEARVLVENTRTNEQIMARASVPSGASTGKYEAVELRDQEKRYMGLGVERAVNHVNTIIHRALKGRNLLKFREIDEILLSLDASENKEHIGANATLSVSLACMKAGAKALKIPLYEYIGGINAHKLPVPMMNILNGGAHSDNLLDVQEFMILPLKACCFKEGLRWCVEVYHTLKKILKEKKMSIAVGDEGGFAPNCKDEKEALDLIIEAIHRAGYEVGKDKDFMISLDIAASEWGIKSDDKFKEYHLPKSNRHYTSKELCAYWKDLIEEYPIFSIEDPLDEDDWYGWSHLTGDIGEQVKLIGDDLFVTNLHRFKKGVQQGCGNGILIKPNQIGTVTETMDTINYGKEHGYITIMSHRSGETEDTSIADLAVGLNTGYIKTGAPCRGERTAKYNRLLRIEEIFYSFER